MPPDKQEDELFLTDESDEEDLFSIRARISKTTNNNVNSNSSALAGNADVEKSTSAPNPSPSSASKNSGRKIVIDEDDDDPDWVRDFSQPNDAQEDRRRALTSVYDGDDDSLIDLTSERGDDDDEHNGQSMEVDVAAGTKNPLDKKEPSSSSSKANGSASKKTNGASQVATKSAEVKANSNADTKKSTEGRGSSVPKDALPLVFAPKLDDALVLVQGGGEDEGEGLDLSGDVGAVGRVKVENGKLFMDIKGVLYSTFTYPTNAMCVVSVGEDEARITAVLNEAVILKPERDILASEEVVAGTLDEDDDAHFSADELSEEDGAKNNAAAAKGDKNETAGKTQQARGKKKAATGNAKKPKSKAAGSIGPTKSLTKTVRKKSSK